MPKQPLKFKIVPDDYGRWRTQISLVINVLLLLALVFTIIYTRSALNSIRAHMEELSRELTTTPEESAIKEMLDKNASYLSRRDRIRLARFIVKEGESRDIDKKTMFALINHESRFNPRARSHKGALGLMQVLPSTGKLITARLGIPWKGEATLLNPFTNVLIGLEYLSILKKELGGSIKPALAAYERGPAYVKNGGAHDTPYTQAILAAAERI